jgi:hypothetical protein
VARLPNVLSSLQRMGQILDRVKLGLNQYLETKRLSFPRLYFLSNPEMVPASHVPAEANGSATGSPPAAHAAAAPVGLCAPRGRQPSHPQALPWYARARARRSPDDAATSAPAQA